MPPFNGRQLQQQIRVFLVFIQLQIQSQIQSLLAPTLSSLRQMLKVVEEFGLQYDVKFNPDKSQLLVYNGRKPEGFEICFNEVKIHAVEGAQHLGHPI